MKLKICLSVMIVFAIVGCGRSSSPADSVKKWITHLANGEISEAVKMHSTKAANQFGIQTLERTCGDLSQGLQKSTVPFKGVTIISEKVVGDVAEVNAKLDGGSDDFVVELSKENGEWRIDYLR